MSVNKDCPIILVSSHFEIHRDSEQHRINGDGRGTVVSVGGASFFLGDCCSVEGDCANMDVHFFFTAFGKMRTLGGIGSVFYLS